MKGPQLLAVLLLGAGILSLAYGGFSYTKETHNANIGPIHLAVEDKERVNVPIWAGVLAAVAGGALLVTSGRKS